MILALFGFNMRTEVETFLSAGKNLLTLILKPFRVSFIEFIEVIVRKQLVLIAQHPDSEAAN